MAGAFLLVALFKKQIILGQRVPDVADHRKPSRRLGRGVTQAAAVHGVVCDGAEFMIGDVRRQIEERGLDLLAGGQSATSLLARASQAIMWTRRHKVQASQN